MDGSGRSSSRARSGGKQMGRREPPGMPALAMTMSRRWWGDVASVDLKAAWREGKDETSVWWKVKLGGWVGVSREGRGVNSGRGMRLNEVGRWR